MASPNTQIEVKLNTKQLEATLVAATLRGLADKLQAGRVHGLRGGKNAAVQTECEQLGIDPSGGVCPGEVLALAEDGKTLQPAGQGDTPIAIAKPEPKPPTPPYGWYPLKKGDRWLADDITFWGGCAWSTAATEDFGQPDRVVVREYKPPEGWRVLGLDETVGAEDRFVMLWRRDDPVAYDSPFFFIDPDFKEEIGAPVSKVWKADSGDCAWVYMRREESDRGPLATAYESARKRADELEERSNARIDEVTGKRRAYWVANEATFADMTDEVARVLEDVKNDERGYMILPAGEEPAWVEKHPLQVTKELLDAQREGYIKCGCGGHSFPEGADPYAAHRTWVEGAFDVEDAGEGITGGFEDPPELMVAGPDLSGEEFELTDAELRAWRATQRCDAG